MLPEATHGGDQDLGHGHQAAELTRTMLDHTLVGDVTQGNRQHDVTDQDALERIITVIPVSGVRQEEAERIHIEIGADPDHKAVTERTPLQVTKQTELNGNESPKLPYSASKLIHYLRLRREHFREP